MYENAVPVFEAKNKLSLYLHKAQTDGPVFISSHGKPAYAILSIEDYEEMKTPTPKEKSLFESIQEARKKYGLEDDDFDYPAYFDSIREHGYDGPPGAEHMYD